MVPPVLDVIRSRYKTIYGSLFLGALMTLTSLLFIQNLSFVHRAELGAYDNALGLRHWVPGPRNIVIVGVDGPSIKDLSNDQFPIPRHFMAKALDYLRRAQPRAIGIDFEYFGPSLYNRSGASDDAPVAAAMKHAGNVVLVSAIQGAAASDRLDPNLSTAYQPPIDRFAAAEASEGVANVYYDADGVLRAADLLQLGPGGSGPSGQLYPSFPVAVASVALHKSVSQVVRGLPRHMLINWGNDQAYPLYEYENLVNGEAPLSAFRNKIVLFIPFDVRFADVKSVPGGQTYGGYVQADTLNTILGSDPILPVSDVANNLVILGLGLLLALLVSRFGILWSTGAAGVAIVGYFLAANAIFQTYNTWFHQVAPEVTIVLVYAIIMAYRFATEERLRRKTKKIFGLYVKPEVVETLVESHDYEKALQGRRQDVSVLFVDVRGFTSMSEHMQPEDVVRALDVYLEELTASVQDFGGTLNKYVGDELIGAWNLPKEQPDHAMRAVRCGLDMVARMDKINQQLRSQNLPALKYGIGINSGEAVVGQMGSSFRKQYDIIGDTMNTGARLCSAAGGGEIIIGQRTWEEIGPDLILEETEPLRLKGKSEPLRTFLVLGIRPPGEPAPAAAPVPAQ